MFAAQLLQQQLQRRTRMQAAIAAAAAEMELAPVLPALQSGTGKTYGTADFTAAIKHQCVVASRGLSLRRAAVLCGKLLSKQGVAAPSKSALAHWRKAVAQAEAKVLKASGEAGLGKPAPEVVEAAVLSALEDRRAAASGRQVPQDVVDSVVVFMKDMLAAKASVTRADVRVEFLATMLEMHPELCKENGGWFTCSEDFLRSFEQAQGLSRRRVTTGGDEGKLSEFLTPDIMRELFQARIASVVHQGAAQGAIIPPELVVGADETGIHLVPSTSVVLAPKGSKRVAREDGDDKRQITGMVAHTMDGVMLPLQLVFAGKTARVLPALPREELAKYRPLLSVTHNHWSSDTSIMQWLKVVVVPFLLRRKRAMGLPATFPALLIWDVHWSHRHAAVRKLIADSFPWLRLAYVPARTTSYLQVCDVSINKPLKNRVQAATRQWRIETRKQGSALVRSVPLLRLQITRSMMEVAAGIEREIILNGVRKVGLDAVFDPERVPALLETAAELQRTGRLWQATSKNDMVCPGGDAAAASMPFVQQGEELADDGGAEDGGAAAGAELGADIAPAAVPPAAASGGSAGAAGADSEPAPVPSALQAPLEDSDGEAGLPGRRVAVGGGVKRPRPRTYRCGWCCTEGHVAKACPDRLAGKAPHTKARKSVRDKFQRLG